MSDKAVRVYFIREGSCREDYVDIVGNPLLHVFAPLITRVEPVPDSRAPEPAGREDWPFVEEIGRDGKPTGYWIRKGSPLLATPDSTAAGDDVAEFFPVPSELIEQAARHACRIQGMQPDQTWVEGCSTKQWERLSGTVHAALHYAMSRGLLRRLSLREGE